MLFRLMKAFGFKAKGRSYKKTTRRPKVDGGGGSNWWTR